MAVDVRRPTAAERDSQRQALLDDYGIQTQNVTCTACNSDTSAVDQLGCHSNLFACDIKTNALNGDCAEVLPDAQFQQCVAQKTNFACNCDSSCEQSCAYYGLCDCCTCTPTASAPPAATCDGGAPSDSGIDSGACVDFTTSPPLQSVIAVNGVAPTPTGGPLADGLYQVTSAKVYGTGQTPGTPVATYGGFLRIAGSSFEAEYSGSTVTSFQGAGTFTVGGGTATLTFSCSNPTTSTSSLGYTVTGATTVDFTSIIGGYTSVATYTHQ